MIKKNFTISLLLGISKVCIFQGKVNLGGMFRLCEVAVSSVVSVVVFGGCWCCTRDVKQAGHELRIGLSKRAIDSFGGGWVGSAWGGGEELDCSWRYSRCNL